MQDRKLGLNKLLVAEDNPINMVIVTHMLTSLGYTFDAVENGFDCLRLFRENEYSLVLTDISMPEIDGIEVATEIRNGSGEGRDIPIIALTANADLLETELFKAARINEVLAKPFSKAELRDCIEKWL